MAPKRTEGSRAKASKGNPQRRSTKRAPEAPAEPVVPPSPQPPPPLPPVALPRLGYRGAFIGILLLIGVAAAIVGALRLRDGKGSFELKLGVPTETSVSDLRAYASGAPVFWVGPPKAGRLEVTRTARGEIYVRYLAPGVALGDPTANYTTIATYSMPSAYATLQRSARTAGSAHRNVGKNELAVWRRSRPTSVYLAYRGGGELVEVYDPSPRRALSLALGRVRRVS